MVHDYYCYTRNRKWADVDNVFFEAALDRGTPEWKAKYLYAGILLRGPRWPDPRSAIDRGTLVYAQTTPSPLPKSSTPVAPPPFAAGKTDQEIFEDLRVSIEKEKPTRDQIRKRVEEARPPRWRFLR